MKKITLLMVLLISLSINSQTTLFEDDFESYTNFIIDNIGNWLVFDFDLLPTYTGGGGTYDNQGDPMAFQIFNPSAAGVTNSSSGTEVRNFDPYDGVKYAAAWAAVPSGGQGNDDWLVTPVITLAASGNSATFQVKAMSNSYGDENYEVGVFVGSGTPSGGGDFTIIGGTRTATYPDWEEVTIDLSSYDGQDIRIGFHYISTDVYMLMIDAFSVNTTLSTSDFELNSLSHSYNKDTDMLRLKSSILPLTGIEIYNLLGKKVLNKALANNQEFINLSSISEGIYFARINFDGNLSTFKFVKY